MVKKSYFELSSKADRVAKVPFFSAVVCLLTHFNSFDVS